MKINGSILKRYGPIYIAVSAILAISISYFLYTKERLELLKRTEDTNQRIFKSFTLSIENPLRLSNLRSIAEIVGIYRSIGVEYIKILDADNITIFEMGMVDNLQINEELRQIVHLSEEIGSTDYKIGTVDIISSLENLNHQLDNLVTNIVLFGTMIFLLMSITSLVVFNLLAKRIKIFDDWVKMIKNLKDLKDFPDNKYNEIDDEIGRLYLSFNQLIKDLLASEKREIEASKLSSIGQAARLLAHDIRKPFSQVKSILSTFETNQDNGFMLSKAKTDINKSISHVESMIDDIMDYSREEIVETKPTYLLPILDFSIRQASIGFRDTDIDFSYNFHHSYRPLVDEERIARAICNIIGNSIEAITIIGKKNFGKIHFITNDITINDQAFIELTIGNDGPPIMNDDIPKLFESFFTKGKKKGTGLGLASVRKIILLHNGDISVRNISEFMGVEFKITIPASYELDNFDRNDCPQNIKDIFSQIEVTSTNQYDELENKIKEIPQTNYKVLLLEDEVLYKAAVRNILKMNDKVHAIVNLFEASNVEDAVKLLTQENIEYVIADIDLAEVQNGFDFLKTLKDNFPHVKAIVHSNRCIKEDKLKAKDLGALAFIPKPLELINIIDLITYEAKDKATNNSSKKSSNNSYKNKILFYADDDEIIRKAAEKHIAKINRTRNDTNQIQTFASGEDLLAAVEAGNNVDIVITDHNMGAMSGIELVRKLREINFDKKIFIVANYSKNDFEKIALHAGADGFFQAPLDVAILNEMIQ